MRTRVRVVQTQLELPPPFAGRMRVKPAATQLTLPVVHEVLKPIVEPSRWASDLMATHRGELPFAVLERRHLGLLRTIVRPWCSRLPAPNIGPDDLLQLARIEMWLGVSRWDAQYGVPIQSYVRMRINKKLLTDTDKQLKRYRKGESFLAQQIVEEKVIVVHTARTSDSEGAQRFVSVCVPDEAPEAPFDPARVAAYVVGGLPSKQARVVAGLFVGEQTETVTQLVYGSKCKRPRKAALRAFAAATALVHSSNDAAQRTTKEDDHSNESSTEEVFATRRARSSRKAGKVDDASHLGEGL